MRWESGTPGKGIALGMLPDWFFYGLTLVLGIAVGSFLNVCIFRIPLGQEVVRTASHCMACGHDLAWYDNIPLVSWIRLGGRCRYCGEPISKQYPAVEALNGVLWLVTVVLGGVCLYSFLCCLVISALIVLSVIDFRTLEIPFGINLFILICGVVAAFADPAGLKSHLIGMVIVSVPLEIILLASGGRAIGGGDVKLFFAAGLMLGMSGTLVAFILACFFASVIHIARMKLLGAGRVLAMGPYIAMGIMGSMWFGPGLVDWYLGLFGM